jgi:hypothetical protein
MKSVLFTVFIVLHGLVHLLYAGQALRFFELRPGLTWPDGAWTLSRLLGHTATRSLAAVLLALTPVFVSLLAFKIQQLAWQREPPGSYDCAYWQAQGWLDPGCIFYLAHRANMIKVALARLMGAAVYRFVV